MVGFEIHCWWRFCWAIMAPFFILFIICYGLISYEPLTYNDYVYPWWVNLLGLAVASSSVLCIPIAAILQLLKTPGTFTQVSRGAFLYKLLTLFLFCSVTKYREYESYWNLTRKKEESFLCCELQTSRRAPIRCMPSTITITAAIRTTIIRPYHVFRFWFSFFISFLSLFL